CIGGGLQDKVVLGSRSSLEPIQTAAVLTCIPGRIGRHFTRAPWQLQNESERLLSRIDLSPGTPGKGLAQQHWHELRLLPGTQANWFPHDLSFGENVQRALPPPFQVLADSNRMGLRLAGPPMPFPKKDMVSEPVCPGSIQVTRDGGRIILGVDG